MDNTGTWPKDFTKVVMIPLQKKQDAVESADHRTINLKSHASKIMLRIVCILTNRIEAKAKDFIERISLALERVVEHARQLVY